MDLSAVWRCELWEVKNKIIYNIKACVYIRHQIYHMYANGMSDAGIFVSWLSALVKLYIYFMLHVL
jgi:hypothetical protein